MLSFVNIENEISFQDRLNAPEVDFGLQIALKNRPLDFQYLSSEAVSSFSAIKISNIGIIEETISLSTSLITSNGTYHICDGNTDYSTDLDCGVYYFLVNGKYQSESFQVFDALVEGSEGLTPISISGLEFFDNTLEVPWRQRIGSPYLTFGIQYSRNTTILPFIYKSSEAISSFELVGIDVFGNETSVISISTSFLDSDGDYHYSLESSYTFECGYYYFRVNNKYESEIFGVINLENIVMADALLLETGDYLLLETGDRLLLE